MKTWDDSINRQESILGAYKSYCYLLEDNESIDYDLSKKICGDFLSNIESNTDETWIKISDIVGDRLHTKEFDTPHPEWIYEGLIVVLIDEQENSRLILDGNHRLNTLLGISQDILVKMIIVKAQDPRKNFNKPSSSQNYRAIE